MNLMLKSLFALALILLLFAVAPAQARRAMMPADILRVASLSDAEVSPDGEWVVYTVSTTDGNQTVSTLWLVRPGERFFRIPPSGRPLEQRRSPETPITPGRPLLPSGWNGANPRWSPDGKCRVALRGWKRRRCFCHQATNADSRRSSQRVVMAVQVLSEFPDCAAARVGDRLAES